MTGQVKLSTAGAGPLSLLMPPTSDDSGSGLMPEDTMSGPLSTAMTELLGDARMSPDDKWKDEQLAFAGGMSDPSGNGAFGGALTNAFKSQSAQRTKNRELQMQYLPTVINALSQQQQLQMQQAQMRQLQQMLASGDGGGFVANLSKKYGIAPEEIISDIAFNGGKNIHAMISKRTAPDVAFQDGVAFNKTALGQRMIGLGGQDDGQGGMSPAAGPGGAMFMPGVTTAADGTTTVRVPNGRGGVDIQVPDGALRAARSYADTKNRSAASMEPAELTPRGGQPQLTTRERKADLGNAGPGTNPARGDPVVPSGGVPDGAFKGLPAPQPGMIGSFQGDPEKVMRSIANIKDLQERSNALDAYTRQQNGTQGLQQRMQQAQDSGNVAEAQRLRTLIEQQQQPPAQYGLELQSPAEAKRQEEAIGTENKQYAANAADLKNAKIAVSQLDNAIGILNKGTATSSGIGSMRDSAYAFVGKESDAAAQDRELKVLQGWLTSHVPRMEGPQSNFDVENYQQMAGMVGNEKLPIKTRLAAATKARELISEAAPKFFGSSWADKNPSGNIPTQGNGFQISPDIIKAERERRKGAK